MAEKIETIRKAIHLNRGGFENADDGQIRTIWRSLSTATQKEYLESVKNQEKRTTNTHE